MRRHIGFSDRGEMESYILNLIPQHTYYSTAYYEKPYAGTMADKGWSGADLIFDLDADHIVRGAYDQMLARVKVETEKLIAMLTEEFGMDKKVYSARLLRCKATGKWGGRGGFYARPLAKGPLNSRSSCPAGRR